MASLYSNHDKTRECPQQQIKVQAPWRTDFRRDYARLIHSCAFRRLVGKTQLFPSLESDFFRNRLTHSIEVAQIAKSIAEMLNHRETSLQKNKLDLDLIETAALAHDLGHPPFGHNGEIALDKCMRHYGGFEGNAQTLRILTRLEKKETDDPDECGIDEKGNDSRYGLNLCFRTLAAVLKYDDVIPTSRIRYDGVKKGYYKSEAGLVREIKNNVLSGTVKEGAFKTIECHIMDLADDIAYSTYDIEDALKAEFLTPLDFISPKEELVRAVCKEINSRLKTDFRMKDVQAVLWDTFSELIALTYRLAEDKNPTKREIILKTFNNVVVASKELAKNGYIRTRFTSSLVDEFIRGVQFEYNNDSPPLSVARLNRETHTKVEVLKRFSYCSLILSHRLKIVETRGKEIVEDIFTHIAKNKGGQELLPQDFRIWYERSKSKKEKMRVVCDFIAGMTDRYAVEFYSRLHSEDPETIFKPY